MNEGLPECAPKTDCAPHADHEVPQLQRDEGGQNASLIEFAAGAEQAVVGEKD